MLPGCWIGNVFLMNICCQVHKFRQSLSFSMAKKEDFFTIPTAHPISDDDPHTRNENSIATAPVKNGPDGHRAAEMQPEVHLWG